MQIRGQADSRLLQRENFQCVCSALKLQSYASLLGSKSHFIQGDVLLIALPQDWLTVTYFGGPWITRHLALRQTQRKPVACLTSLDCHEWGSSHFPTLHFLQRSQCPRERAALFKIISRLRIFKSCFPAWVWASEHAAHYHSAKVTGMTVGRHCWIQKDLLHATPSNPKLSSSSFHCIANASLQLHKRN